MSRIYHVTYAHLRDHADRTVYGKGSLGPEAQQGPQRLRWGHSPDELSEILALTSLLCLPLLASVIEGIDQF